MAGQVRGAGGRLRFAVVRETLRRQLEAMGCGRWGLRVLDVGDGRDAVALAEAGHHVTLLDPAATWLAEARRRTGDVGVSDRLRTVQGSVEALTPAGDGYDLVLCHLVLHYRPRTPATSTVSLLCCARGRLSVMALNAAARVVMRLTREGPEAALAQSSDVFDSATFATTGWKATSEEVEAAMAESGLVNGRYAARVASDYVVDDPLCERARLLRGLGKTRAGALRPEPFVRLGGLWQLVAERPVRPES